MLAQLRHYFADAVVERRDHRGEDPGLLVLDVAVAVEVLRGRLQRHVGRVVRQVEEEGFLVVPVDEVEGLAGQDLGQVLGLFDHLPAAEDGPPPRLGDRLRIPVLHSFGGWLDEDRTSLHAEELVEAAVERVFPALPAELPLADRPGGVAGGPHHLGQRRLVEVEAIVLDRRVELVAVSLRVAAGHQPGAGRAADRGGHVAGLEAHARGAQGVDVRGLDDLAAVQAEIAVAEIVGEDEDDVGLALLVVASGVAGRVLGTAERGANNYRDDHRALKRHVAPILGT